MRDFLTRTLPGGIGTLNASGSPIMVGDADAVDLDNLTFENDTWAKVGGADKVNTTAITGGPTVMGHHEWVRPDGVREQVTATSDGKLVTIDVNGIVKTLITGIGSNRVGVFAEGSTGGARRLFFANGSTNLLMYDGGASAAVIGAPAADWTTNPPTAIASHNGRMWAIFGDRLYGSVLLTHDNFTAAGSVTFNIYPGEGEELVGLASKWGRLFLFKRPLGIYYLDDSAADFTTWTTPRHGRNVGSIGHRSIVEAVEDVLFISPDGYIHALSAVQEFGDVKSSAILPIQLGNFVRKNVDMTRGNFVQSTYFESKRKVYWGLTRKGSSVNDLILGLDYHNAGTVQAFVSRRDICESLSMITNIQTNIRQPAAGDSAGFLWMLETETFDKDGTAYNGFYTTNDIALFPNGNRNANLKELEVEFNQSGNWEVDIDVIVDGVFRETRTFQLQGSGAALGSFVLGTDMLGLQTIQNSRRRLHGDGRRVRFVVSNGRLGESFQIVSKTVKFLPGNDR